MASSVVHRTSSVVGPYPQADADVSELRDLWQRVESARSNYDPRVLEATEIAVMRWFEPLLDELVAPVGSDRTDALSEAHANLARLVTTWRGGDEVALVAAVRRTIPMSSSERSAGSGHLDLTSSVRLGEVMSSPAITLPGWMQTIDAARVLVDNGFTGAPVVDDRGDLVGIVTEADLLRDRLRQDAGAAAARHGARKPPTTPPARTLPTVPACAPVTPRRSTNDQDSALESTPLSVTYSVDAGRRPWLR